MIRQFKMNIILWLLPLFVTACDPLIFVNGRALHEEANREVLRGPALLGDKMGLPGVHVALRPAGNVAADAGSKTVTDGEGNYRISGVEHRAWWHFQKEWEVVFEKEGFETVIMKLNKEKHKDPDSTLRYQYRLDALLSRKK